MKNNSLILSYINSDIYTLLFSLKYWDFNFNLSIDNFKINDNKYQTQNILIVKDFKDRLRQLSISDTLFGLSDISNSRNKNLGATIKDINFDLDYNEIHRDLKNNPELIDHLARYGIDIEKIEQKEEMSSFIWLGYTWLKLNDQKSEGINYGASYNTQNYSTGYSRSKLDNLDFSSFSVKRLDEFIDFKYSTSESYDPGQKYSFDKYSLSLIPDYYHFKYNYNNVKLNSNELENIYYVDFNWNNYHYGLSKTKRSAYNNISYHYAFPIKVIENVNLD